MNKLLILCTLLFLIPFPSGVNAFEIKVGEELYITEEVNDDLYTAAGIIDISAPIAGDLVIAGGQLNVSSNIEEDLNIAGGDITISGDVGDDVRVAGGSIRITSNIAGDLVVGGGDVRINNGTIVEGDLVVWGGRIVLDGDVNGDARIAAGEFTLNGIINGDADITVDTFNNPAQTGVIVGNLSYKSNENIVALENSTQGLVMYEQTVSKEQMENGIIAFITGYIFIKLLGLFIFSTIIYLFLERLFLQAGYNLRTQTGKSFLYGFLIVVGLPLVIFLLLVSIIGIPIGLFLLFAYIFMFVFFSLINVIVFTGFFVDKYYITELYKKILIILGLTILFGLINILNVIVGFFTLGALAIKESDMVRDLRR